MTGKPGENDANVFRKRKKANQKPVTKGRQKTGTKARNKQGKNKEKTRKKQGKNKEKTRNIKMTLNSKKLCGSYYKRSSR